MAEVTWLGDEDPSAQVIEQGGHTFVKGAATKIDDKDPAMAKLKGNAFFQVGKGGDVIESKEPEPVDPDEGTEREAVKTELDRLNVKYDGRAKIETLREALAKAQA